MWACAPASDFVNFFTSDRKSSFFFGFPLFSTKSLLLRLEMEARAGIEPAIKLLQSPALPLGYPASQRTRHLRAGRFSFKFFQKKTESRSFMRLSTNAPHQKLPPLCQALPPRNLHRHTCPSAIEPQCPIASVAPKCYRWRAK